ncbi:hypothetical protein F5Y18DRAFT_424089 [Xylariaceae sp. FL1019]|nr:hypothetical protein F5Y18DRAFT_424089 [Xylariaceae sp. FL1019]
MLHLSFIFGPILQLHNASTSTVLEIDIVNDVYLRRISYRPRSNAQSIDLLCVDSATRVNDLDAMISFTLQVDGTVGDLKIWMQGTPTIEDLERPSQRDGCLA